MVKLMSNQKWPISHGIQTGAADVIHHVPNNNVVWYYLDLGAMDLSADKHCENIR
jgi:hypothetical protein